MRSELWNPLLRDINLEFLRFAGNFVHGIIARYYPHIILQGDYFWQSARSTGYWASSHLT